jgi:hypothetical protein
MGIDGADISRSDVSSPPIPMLVIRVPPWKSNVCPASAKSAAPNQTFKLIRQYRIRTIDCRNGTQMSQTGAPRRHRLPRGLMKGIFVWTQVIECRTFQQNVLHLTKLPTAQSKVIRPHLLVAPTTFHRTYP